MRSLIVEQSPQRPTEATQADNAGMLICIYSLWEQFYGSLKREGAKGKKCDFNFHIGHQFCFQMKSLWAVFFSTFSKRRTEILFVGWKSLGKVFESEPEKSQITDTVQDNHSAALPNNRVSIQHQKLAAHNIPFHSNLHTDKIYQPISVRFSICI